MLFFFFYNDTATTEIYTLSLHDALPISTLRSTQLRFSSRNSSTSASAVPRGTMTSSGRRSEEHTSELQSPYDLVCRLLLEKKKFIIKKNTLILHHLLRANYSLTVLLSVS